MTDNLLGAILGHPRSVRFVGQLVCVVATLLALLGLLVRFRQMFESDPAPAAVDAFLPGWIAWAVPQTLLGWFGVAALFATGFCIAKGARAIQRLTHEAP